MEIVYVDDVIVDAKTGFLPLQNALTLDERIALFGCAMPDATLWEHMVNLERDNGQSTKADAVNRMVAIGAITQARADVLLG